MSPMGKDFKKDADAPAPPTPSSGQIPLSKAIFSRSELRVFSTSASGNQKM